MKLTKDDKLLLLNVIGKITDNVLNGENKDNISTDESLIFTFDIETITQLVDIEAELVKELDK